MGKSRRYNLPSGLFAIADLPLEFLLGPFALEALMVDVEDGNGRWM